MTEIVAADIGGTHARFALARLDAAGQVEWLDEPLVLRCADHASLEDAWAAFGRHLGRALPRAAAIAIACPVGGEVLKLTNNAWIIRPAELNAVLGIDSHVLVNDFEAVAHAVAASPPAALAYLCGPAVPLPDQGVISVLGPGTGLGVAMLVRRSSDDWQVLPTEASHGDFAPTDAREDAVLAYLRRRHGRVSAERVLSGPGLAAICAAFNGGTAPALDDAALWSAALAGSDRSAAAALDLFCAALGGFAGNMALAHGAAGVVIGGGLGARLADRLGMSGFAARFVAKGRFEPLLRSLPVKLIRHPQPGLLGAAAAFGRAATAT